MADPPPEHAEDQHVRLADGRRLGATVRGEGGPTVVFEAGMGAARHAWDLVAPAVAEHTRTVAYDRAGYGASTVDPEPRTVPRAAADLVELLALLGDGPAILVAHSYGGPLVREALAVAPERVAGLVLVDQTDERCDLYFTPAMARFGRWFGAVLPVAGRLGLVRLMARSMAKPLPEDARRAVAEESGSVAGARAHARELAASAAELRRLRDHPHPATDVPVTLISGTKEPKGRANRERRAGLVAAHRARAGSLPHGRHVAASSSEHLAPFTEPELVVAEVLRLVALAREG